MPSAAPFEALRESGLDSEQSVVVLARVAGALGGSSRSGPRFRHDGMVTTVGGLAGIIRLTSRVELEIVPKFLDSASQWQADFFQLALLTRHATLLGSAPVAASVEQSSDLSTIVARNLLAMIRANSRTPLRTYRVRRWVDFEVDGELDPDAACLPSEDGFLQTQPTFSNENKFAALIDQALTVLATEVSDPALAAQLRHARTLPERHREERPLPLRAPGRHRRWQPALDLAYLVCAGFGGGLSSGALHAPGFYMDTWRAWEDLITFAVRRAYKAPTVVRSQVPLGLGVRVRGSLTEAADTKPDVLVESPTSTLVIDAKYKGRPDREYRITNEDLYEVLAFLRAASTDRAVLLYPADAEEPPAPVGTVTQFEAITVDTMTVIGAKVAVQGLGRSKGLASFASNVGQWLTSTA